MRAVIIALAVLSLGANFTDEQAIRAIAGEARGEPFAGQIAVGEAIRNRGTLRGVYGAAVPRKLVSAREWLTAKSAWRVSATSTLTGGAIGWGNEKDWRKFVRCAWFKNTVKTVTISGHTFYRMKTKQEA